jgi:hypothetical protein
MSYTFRTPHVCTLTDKNNCKEGENKLVSNTFRTPHVCTLTDKNNRKKHKSIIELFAPKCLN